MWARAPVSRSRWTTRPRQDDRCPGVGREGSGRPHRRADARYDVSTGEWTDLKDDGIVAAGRQETPVHWGENGDAREGTVSRTRADPDALRQPGACLRGAAVGSEWAHVPRAAHVPALRGGNGVWLRLAQSDGDRTAESAITSTGMRGLPLSWGHRRNGPAAGIDLPFGDGDMALGLAARHPKGRATVARGGIVDVTGTGLGGHAGPQGRRWALCGGTLA